MAKSKDIKVLKDIEDLCFHTMQLLENSNNFPKKYKFSLNNRILNQVFELYDYTYDANDGYGEDRLSNQMKAISMCGKLKMSLRIVKRYLDPSCSMIYWDGLVEDIKTQLERWHAYSVRVITKK